MNSQNNTRRQFIKAVGAGISVAALSGSALAANRKSIGRVVVIGGGYGGATAAKYLRMWSEGRIDVTLIERSKEFVSCPMSNEVLAGYRNFDTLRHGYDGLKKNWGVKLVHASVTAIDVEKKRVKTDHSGEFAFDHVIVAPGIDFLFDQITGYNEAAREKILHAWKAGPQTLALRKQLEAMPDGGVYALTIPKAPYRCPPGPYERACLIASYLKTNKPKSKVLVLDANDKVQSKEKLFRGVWEADYKEIIDYQPNWNAVSVDAAQNSVTNELGDTVKAAVLNVVPPHRAGDIAQSAGLINVNQRWCAVDWVTLESTAVKNVHVIGDALMPGPTMPKSGHMANQHGKAAAAAIVEMLSGRPAQPTLMANTCYSMVDENRGMHVASVHRYDAEKKAPQPVAGAGGVSIEPNKLEGIFAHAWANTIWKEMLT
ncbi:MAG: FAD-dependent oxidoreductase [Rhodocyclaceae bacterium]|nr:FAD-dependent oxidoreductase [Rhodocyclaceae bacterium]